MVSRWDVIQAYTHATGCLVSGNPAAPHAFPHARPPSRWRQRLRSRLSAQPAFVRALPCSPKLNGSVERANRRPYRGVLPSHLCSLEMKKFNCELRHWKKYNTVRPLRPRLLNPAVVPVAGPDLQGGWLER